jgi:hypothetical protein
MLALFTRRFLSELFIPDIYHFQQSPFCVSLHFFAKLLVILGTVECPWSLVEIFNNRSVTIGSWLFLKKAINQMPDSSLSARNEEPYLNSWKYGYQNYLKTINYSILFLSFQFISREISETTPALCSNVSIHVFNLIVSQTQYAHFLCSTVSSGPSRWSNPPDSWNQFPAECMTAMIQVHQECAQMPTVKELFGTEDDVEIYNRLVDIDLRDICRCVYTLPCFWRVSTALRLRLIMGNNFLVTLPEWGSNMNNVHSHF